MMRTIARPTIALATIGIAFAWGLAPSGAAPAHHANETITVSKTTGLKDGDVVTVTFSGFTPGGVDGTHPDAKVVIAGQGELTTIPDKLNFVEYASAPAVRVAPDGTGSTQFTVTSDHGTVQDGTTLDCTVQQCWIVVVQEPFLPQPNYDTEAISFGAAAPPPTSPPATAPPVTAPVATVPAPTTTAPVGETTTTTTTTPETTTTVKDKVKVDSGDGESGSNTGLIVGLVAAAAAVLGGGGYLATRKKADDGSGDIGSGDIPPV